MDGRTTDLLYYMYHQWSTWLLLSLDDIKFVGRVDQFLIKDRSVLLINKTLFNLNCFKCKILVHVRTSLVRLINYCGKILGFSPFSFCSFDGSLIKCQASVQKCFRDIIRQFFASYFFFYAASFWLCRHRTTVLWSRGQTLFVSTLHTI